jgi:hypothetical protein
MTETTPSWATARVSLGSARSNEITAEGTAFDFLQRIRDGEWELEIDMVRDAVANENDAETKRLKLELPAVLWSGTFSMRRASKLIRHSGLICLDLDDVEEFSQLEPLRKRINDDPCVAAVFRSPRGNGLKVLMVADDPNPDHQAFFEAAKSHFLVAHNLPIDNSGKDVSRLCFVSHDPDLFIRADPTPLNTHDAPACTSSVPPVQTGDVKPGDDFDARCDVPQMLKDHGWKPVQGGKYWTRPGKTSGISASWGIIPDRFWCFSSSTLFLQNHSYRPWAVYAVLEHGGDFRAAARALSQMGFGTPTPERATPPVGDFCDEDEGGAGLGVETVPDEADGGVEGTWAYVRHERVELPAIITATEEEATDIPTPPEVIKGVLYRGAKMMIAGPSKARKTYALIDLGLSVAGGVSWFGIPTVQSRVLYLNFELQAFASKRRREEILTRDARFSSIIDEVNDNISYWHLRGALSRRGVNPRNTYEKIIDGVSLFARSNDCGLIIIDPIYKLMQMGGEENRAEDVGRLLNEIEMLAHETGAAIAFCHHFAKGNASQKESMDRASGSGVYARDPDALLTMTPLEDEDCMSVEMILRNFAPKSPLGVRWEYPTWRVDQAVDPADLKGKNKQTSKPSFTSAQLSAELGRFGGRVSSQNVHQVAEFFGVSLSTVWRRWKELKPAENE